MGLSPFSHWSEDDCSATEVPNPDARIFKILKAIEHGEFLIVKMEYPTCTNFNGIKILVYKDVTVEQLYERLRIDPHFSDDVDAFSPIARFEPTNVGIALAAAMCAKCRTK